jgi:hypothetical protein
MELVKIPLMLTLAIVREQGLKGLIVISISTSVQSFPAKTMPPVGTSSMIMSVNALTDLEEKTVTRFVK